MRLTNNVFLTLAFLLICCLPSCIKEQTEDDDEVINHVQVGSSIPSFTVTDDKENTFHAADFKGKRSLLILFNTSCPDCKKALPVVELVWNELKDNADYQIIGIGRQVGMKAINDYWAENELTIPAYPDPDRKVFDLFANSYIPRIYLIDTNGIVQWMAIESLGSTTANDLINKLKELP
ncbi:TlpA family protein disulfide reductase [Parabacteroides sp. OttesenSCG-928-K15]|nr:TlpA family protein disulfide reductase [Parabacteroides sp. OttesenSCG-928-K15]